MIDIESITKLPAPVALMLALNVLAAAIRRTPLTNWVIPFVIFGLGTIVYPRITTSENTAFKQLGEWTLYLQGFLCGAGSFGIDELLSKFPWYKRLTNSFGDAYTQGKPPGATPTNDSPKS